MSTRAAAAVHSTAAAARASAVFYGEHRKRNLLQHACSPAEPAAGPLFAIVATEFSEDNGITTLSSLMDFGNKRARDAAVATGMTDGMEQSYQLLDGVLAKRRLKTGRAPVIGRARARRLLESVPRSVSEVVTLVASV